MKKYIYFNFIFVINTFVLLYSCTNSNDDRLYIKRLNEAKWLYYESNFTITKIGCLNDKVVDSNICFVEGLSIDTLHIGDTLEIKIYSTLFNNIKCFPYGGSNINLFGFYPGVDTVVYRADIDTKFKRLPEIDDSVSTKWEWAGVFARPKQKKMFKEFIIKNQNKINSFLKEEAKKRGYIK